MESNHTGVGCREVPPKLCRLALGEEGIQKARVEIGHPVILVIEAG
jgi:hypothetical protein